MSSATQTLYDYQTREKWLAGRRDGIGASEIAILFGLAPASWGSVYTLWLQKTGRQNRAIDETAEYLEMGHRMEPIVADVYEERTKRKLWKGGGPFVVAVDPEVEVLRCTPDRLVVEAAGMPGNGTFEAKNIGWYVGHNWDEGPPPHVDVQVQSQLACMGYLWGSAAGIVGGNRFLSFDRVRDDAFIAEIRAQVEWFWSFVKNDIPPPIDGSPATGMALKALHPNDNGEEVALPADALAWVTQWERAKAAMSGTEKEQKTLKEEAENRLRDAIGAATFGVLPDGRRLTLKTTSRHIDARDEMFRTLRIESTKGKR